MMNVRLGFGALAAFALLLAGCGGGGSLSSGGGAPAPAEPTDRSIATALVRVDVASGDVSVIPQSGDSRAVFSGGAVEVTTSRLLEDTADVTRRVIKATLKNTLNESIGGLGGLEVSLRSVAPFAAPTTDRRGSTRVNTLAGSGAGTPLDGAALTARLGDVYGSWQDPEDGAIYVSTNNGIKLLKNGQLTSFFPFSTSGPVFRAITGNSSHIYALVGNAVARWEKRPSAQISLVAGQELTAGFVEGAGASARFNNPTDLIVLPNGNLLVADKGNFRIRLVADPGSSPVVSTFVTTEVDALTLANLPSSTGGALSLIAAGNSGGFSSIFVLDIANGSIVGEIGGPVGNVLGAGNVARFNGITDIAARGSVLYVFDAGAFTVKQVELLDGASPASPAGWFVSSLSGVGSSGMINGAGTAAAYSNRAGVSLTAQGELLISDTFNQRLRLIESATGTFPILSGTGGGISGSVTVGNAVSQRSTPGTGGIEYVFPEAVPVGGLVKDATVEQEWAFSLTPGVTSFQFLVTVSGSTLAGGPIPASLGTGSTQAMVRTVNGLNTAPGWVDGQAGTAKVFGPEALVADRLGNIYFAEYTGVGTNFTVRVRRPNGQIATILNSRNISTPATNDAGTGETVGFTSSPSLWVHPDGKLIVLAAQSVINVAITTVEPSTVGYLEPSSWTVRLVMGSNTLNAILNGVGLNARFSFPQALTGTSDGNLFFIAEGSLIRRIRFRGGSRLDPDNWEVDSYCGSSTGGFVNGLGAAARFGFIGDLELDSVGNLYVADYLNSVIRRVDPASNVTTYAGSGVSGYVDAGPTSSQFANPVYLAIDPYGYLYVTDFVTSSAIRVRRVAPNREVRTVVRAAPFQDGLGNTAGIAGILDLVVAADGTLFFGDTGTLRTVERIVLRN